MPSAMNVSSPGPLPSQGENAGTPIASRVREDRRSAVVSEERSASITSSKTRERAAQGFALPGILPEQSWILLDAHACMVIFLKLGSGEAAPLLYAFPLTPSATRIFLALLRAYPQHCPYQALLSALYPASPEEPAPVWEHRVRPIRRALVALAPVLQTIGVDVVALRGRGYVLAPAAPSSTRKRVPKVALVHCLNLRMNLSREAP